jgi:hypothetical protein
MPALLMVACCYFFLLLFAIVFGLFGENEEEAFVA